MKSRSLQLYIKGYADQIFTAEVSYEDGTLLMPDYDPQYDLSMMEFGEPETECLVAIQDWEDHPERVIIRNANVYPGVFMRAAVDWAEHALNHVIHFYKDIEIPDKPEVGKTPIGTMRKLLNQRLGVQHRTYEDLYRGAIGLCQDIWSNRKHRKLWGDPPNSIYLYIELMNDQIFKNETGFLELPWPFISSDLDIFQRRLSYRENSLMVNDMILFALSLTHTGFWTKPDETFFIDNSDDTVYGLSSTARTVADQSDLVGKYEQERLWQIRRLIDVIDANLNKRKWPPMGATK